MQTRNCNSLFCLQRFVIIVAASSKWLSLAFCAFVSLIGCLGLLGVAKVSELKMCKFIKLLDLSACSDIYVI